MDQRQADESVGFSCRDCVSTTHFSKFCVVLGWLSAAAGSFEVILIGRVADPTAESWKLLMGSGIHERK